MGAFDQKRAIAILRQIAREGPCNRTQISKSREVRKLATHPTIWGDVDVLCQWGYLRHCRTVKKTRGPKPSKYYDLTLTGLLFLVSNLEYSKSRWLVDRMIKKYVDLLPELFRLWPAIIEAGVEDVAFRRLRPVLSQVEEIWFEPAMESIRQENVTAILETFLNPQRQPGGESYADHDRWGSAIRQNRTLRLATARYLMGRLTEQVDHAKSFLAFAGALNRDRIEEDFSKQPFYRDCIVELMNFLGLAVPAVGRQMEELGFKPRVA